MNHVMEREWHVDKNPDKHEADPADERWSIHYMVDPGDGLCSTLVSGLTRDVADHIVALHNGAESAALSKRFLEASFADIDFKYSGLTKSEKNLCSKAAFDELVNWIKQK